MHDTADGTKVGTRGVCAISRTAQKYEPRGVGTIPRAAKTEISGFYPSR